MDNMQKYKLYREAGKILISTKIIPYVNEKFEESVVLDSARILGLVDADGNIAPRQESEMMYLLDYTLHEYKIDGKSMIQFYRENNKAENEIEEILLEALEDSYMSLFRVVNTSASKNLVFLKDAFNKFSNVRLTDISFSQTKDRDVLIFTRVLPLPELNMSSGMAGIFQSLLEENLVRDFHRVSKKLKSREGFNEETAKMLFTFFNLNREIGLSVKFDW